MPEHDDHGELVGDPVPEADVDTSRFIDDPTDPAGGDAPEEENDGE